MRLFNITFVFCITLLGCGKNEIAAPSLKSPVTVGFWIGEPQSRTVIDDNGRSTLWSKDDIVSLWAEDVQIGGYSLYNQYFKIYFRNLPATSACFTATLASAMEAGQYRYYAAYPVPQSVNGTQAVFALPATQDGRISNGSAIMIATPCTSTELKPLEVIDDGDRYEVTDRGLSLKMQHKLHALRFYIPSGYNTLGEPVRRIRLTMPQDIAGTVTTDFTDPSAQALLTDGTNTVTLDLIEPLDESAEDTRQYACASVFPPTQTYADGDLLDVILFSDNYAARAQEIDLAGCTFPAGHVTPVVLHPQEKAQRYSIRFTLAENHLGEDIQKITLTAPAEWNSTIMLTVPTGCSWSTDGNNLTISAAEGTTIKTGECFEIGFDSFDDTSIALYRSLNGIFTAEYESEHAWHLTQQFSLDTQTGNIAQADLAVPYLFFEDFSNVGGFSSNDAYKTSSAGSKDAYSFLSGWTGGRIGAETGQSIRIACRRETSADYPARVDSAPITVLKSAVNITVTFDYGADNQYGGLAIGNNGDVGQTCTIGYVTTDTAYKSGATDGTFEDDNSFYIKEYTGSYTNLPHTDTYTIHDAPEWFRLTWRTDVEHQAGTTNTTAWLYIDNIKVQIAR